MLLLLDTVTFNVSWNRVCSNNMTME